MLLPDVFRGAAATSRSDPTTVQLSTDETPLGADPITENPFNFDALNFLPSSMRLTASRSLPGWKARATKLQDGCRSAGRTANGCSIQSTLSNTEEIMPEAEHFEILILGSGQGGKLLAWHLARSGRRVAVVERKWVGGSCPAVACLPSKNEIWAHE